VPVINFFLLLILCSCSILEKHQGSYGAMIFDEPQFNQGQPQTLMKETNILLWSDACGLGDELNIEEHYRLMSKKYETLGSQQIVGIADVEIRTYHFFIGITALPCMKINATPLVVKTSF